MVAFGYHSDSDDEDHGDTQDQPRLATNESNVPNVKEGQGDFKIDAIDTRPRRKRMKKTTSQTNFRQTVDDATSRKIKLPPPPKKSCLKQSSLRSLTKEPKRPNYKTSGSMRNFARPSKQENKETFIATRPSTPSQNDMMIRAYSWYARLGQPRRDNFKDRIKNIQNIDITEEDVDSLPWLMNGRLVNVAKMNKVILGS